MKQGFTLIEVLVATGILLMLFTAGIASYRGASRNQALEADAALIIQVLNIAKTNVQSGKKIACVNKTLDSWQVTFAAKSFTLQEVCADGTVTNGAVYDVASNNSMVAVPTTIKFLPLGQGSTAGTVILGSKTISVSSIGDIQ